jgi:hypothetical protein
VRLDVLEPHTLSRGDRGERPDLIGDEVLDVGRSHIQLAPAEAFQIWESWVRTNGDPVVSRQRNRRTHEAGVARVEATRNIGGRNRGHERGVSAGGDCSAHGCAWPFADVGVQVDPHGLLSTHL